MADVVEIKVRIGAEDAPVRTFVGRFAWTLSELIRAGEKGVTPMERPAPRWSHYIYRLRRDGIPIVTNTEKHTGTFSGTHARYVLGAPVILIEERRA